ncbi:BlaI/MecI/CopY family transcriptional regulator [Aquiflexum gelatinilyticum]|uniref:BlaI/MecI/CopY family transcriptional regulator n=1 Tax=Aquiflexum gelatinilyticum TaxID=2961943 RepID=A0A9X2SZN3_9BACT|nr:BlaI/MecI/CopY family transcriptional regulator [Aquiflexum gelatinilyticum]MCR9014106.1 BlaI/MecI/CopY family transcriptional regulator [Aquiflexum gelatinilyticum]
MNLSNGEEQLMNIIWEKGKAFMKDLLESLPEPKPAVTTVATLLKRLSDKGAIGYTVFGNSREYYPLIQKKTYFSTKVNELVKNFFNNSPSQFASFFTQETDMSQKELESLKKIIEDQLKNKTP